ncbi:fimbrial protein [Providencia sp. Je.9.19]|uniref:fimbrial protein n=1 Tax=unclassified Providencia TaxID=2633465 RepID=UPI003DA861F7
MKNHCVIGGLIFTLVGALPISAFADNSNTIEYSGTLIALPCTVNPDSENVYVYFGENVNAKDLYTGQRGAYSDREFNFYLDDCDISLGNTISAKFTGSATADGMLKLDPISEASGVVVGLETISGKALPVNDTKVESVYPIKDGNMVIPIRAYLKADADAMKNKTIKPGWFTATLTYTLMYE